MCRADTLTLEKQKERKENERQFTSVFRNFRRFSMAPAILRRAEIVNFTAWRGVFEIYSSNWTRLYCSN